MTTSTRDRTGKIARINGTDMLTADAVLKAALLLLVPDEQTQRQAFEKLMPYLYVLRNKGCSWPQLTKLLADCKIHLQPSTVRTYYGEMIGTRMDICQNQMNEQILMLAEIRKETKGADVLAISGKVAAMMDQQRSAASAKIDSMFGSASPAASRREPASPAYAKATPSQHNTHEQVEQPPAASRREPASPAHVKTTPSPRSAHEPVEPAPGKEDQDDIGSFGLLNSSTSGATSVGKPAFFDLDDAPAIPNLAPPSAPPEKKNAAASPHDEHPHANEIWQCLPIQPGIKPLKKQPNVDASVYEEGNMEHPALPGTMLTLDQRLYGVSLEFSDSDGVIRLETSEEKRFRIFWKKPVPVTKTMTSKNFTDMDLTLFRKNSE